MELTKNAQETIFQIILAHLEREAETSRFDKMFEDGVIPRTRTGLVAFFTSTCQPELDEYGNIILS